MAQPIWQTAYRAVRDRDLDAVASIERTLAGSGHGLSEGVVNALGAQFDELRGDEAAALARYEQVREQRALVPEEKLVFGWLLIDTPQSPSAKWFAELRRSSLKDPRVLEGLGRISALHGRGKEALELFERVLQADPKRWSARFQAGLLQLEQGQRAAARSAFEQVVKARPDFEPAWLAYARASALSGPDEAYEASGVLKRAVETFPGRQGLELALVDCLACSGRVADALTAFTPLANRSNDPDILGDFVGLCLQGGFLEPAETMLGNIERLNPEFPRLWYLRGLLARARSDEPEAKSYFEKALGFDPSYAPAKAALAPRKPAPARGRGGGAARPSARSAPRRPGGRRPR